MSASMQKRLYTTLFPKCGHVPVLGFTSKGTPIRAISSASSKTGKVDKMDALFRSVADREEAVTKRAAMAAGPSGSLSRIGLSDEDQAALAKAAGSLSSDTDYYSFHVYSHKHNTHITFTKPNREPIISVSCGNLGFRKGGRGNFDASFQLASYVLNKIRQNPKQLDKIANIQFVLRGFGPGREAVTKAMLGSEGYGIKNKITRVVDSTRLKFGGTRSKAPRRL